MNTRPFGRMLLALPFRLIGAMVVLALRVPEALFTVLAEAFRALANEVADPLDAHTKQHQRNARRFSQRETLRDKAVRDIEKLPVRERDA